MSGSSCLAGCCAVVAGAGGIGAAIATGLADAGATVLILDIDAERLNALACAGIDGRGAIAGLLADLSSATACRAAIQQAADQLGGLQIFVHAVGVNDRRPVLDVSDDAWHRVLALNLGSAFWLGQAAGAHMVSAGYGRMVFVSSVSALLAHKDHSAYAASKGGLNQLVRVMAREWAAHGVCVNAIGPGYIETDLTRAYLDQPGMRESMISLVPAGRLGTPADLVGPAVLLASEHAAFITGQVLYIDGGRTLV